MRYVIFLRGWVFFVLHFVHVLHFIAWHHVHGIGIVFLKLALVHSCHVPLAFFDRLETNRVFRVPLAKPPNPSHTPRMRPEPAPNPTRLVITDVSGSSPNIYKTSPFSYLDFLTYFPAAVRS